MPYHKLSLSEAYIKKSEFRMCINQQPWAGEYTLKKITETKPTQVKELYAHFPKKEKLF